MVSTALADNSKTICKTLGYRAVDAMLNGKDSDQWKDYMSFFAQTPEELARLTFADDLSKTDPDVRESILYIASNAACTTVTLKDMPDAVNDVIDS